MSMVKFRTLLVVRSGLLVLNNAVHVLVTAESDDHQAIVQEDQQVSQRLR